MDQNAIPVEAGQASLKLKFYSDMAKMAREPAWLRCEMAKNAKT